MVANDLIPLIGQTFYDYYELEENKFDETQIS
jgi:hypothetical protein